jgi:hypothetical protein
MGLSPAMTGERKFGIDSMVKSLSGNIGVIKSSKGAPPASFGDPGTVSCFNQDERIGFRLIFQCLYLGVDRANVQEKAQKTPDAR